MPVTTPAGRPAASPMGTMVRVAVDWLVVRAATRKTARAKMNCQLVTQLPMVPTMYSSWAEMKVAVSQAIPKRAIAEIMPALNTDWSGTVFTSGRPRKRMATPTTNMTRTIVVVMSMASGDLGLDVLVVVEVRPHAVHHERGDDDAHDAGGDGDRQDLGEAEVVGRHVGQGQHGGHGCRDGCRRQ